MPRLKTEAKTEPQSPGAFMPDGTWNENCQLRHRGEVDRLVRALVRQRRDFNLTPAQAAKAIGASSQVLAFPNWRQWETCEHWRSAWCATSAEAAVVYEGRCSSGHWCRNHYAHGPEKDCQETVHREKAVRGDVSALVSSVLDKAPAGPVEGTTAPDVAREPEPDVNARWEAV